MVDSCITLRISRKWGTDFTRCGAFVSREVGQPFRMIWGKLAGGFIESGSSGLVKHFCAGGSFSHAFSGEFEPVGIVNQTIEDGIG